MVTLIFIIAMSLNLFCPSVIQSPEAGLLLLTTVVTAAWSAGYGPGLYASILTALMALALGGRGVQFDGTVFSGQEFWGMGGIATILLLTYPGTRRQG